MNSSIGFPTTKVRRLDVLLFLFIFRYCFYSGASVIRMMDHFLTRQVFRRGLTKYLNAK